MYVRVCVCVFRPLFHSLRTFITLLVTLLAIKHKINHKTRSSFFVLLLLFVSSRWKSFQCFAFFCCRTENFFNHREFVKGWWFSTVLSFMPTSKVPYFVEQATKKSKHTFHIQHKSQWKKGPVCLCECVCVEGAFKWKLELCCNL